MTAPVPPELAHLPRYLTRAIQAAMTDPDRVLASRTSDDAMRDVLAEVRRDAADGSTESKPQ